MYNDVGAKPLVLSKNRILIKYAFKSIKIRGGIYIHGKLVFVKLSVNKYNMQNEFHVGIKSTYFDYII